jgi:hypothetical protein
MISTIIEAYLKAIDQATFQKLMNHFLSTDKFLVTIIMILLAKCSKRFQIPNF